MVYYHHMVFGSNKIVQHLLHLNLYLEYFLSLLLLIFLQHAFYGILQALVLFFVKESSYGTKTPAQNI